jgi:integration host factor subunit alpha
MTEPNRKPRTAVTRADLIDAVHKRAGISKAESAAMVELVFKEIANRLERGETVKLSAFGSFAVRSKVARMGRNPKIGKELPITRAK